MQTIHSNTLAKVMAIDTVPGSVVALLQTASAYLRKNAASPDKINEYADVLGRNANAWASAIEANTPSATLVQAEPTTDASPTLGTTPAPATAKPAGEVVAAKPKRGKATSIGDGAAAANAASMRTRKTGTRASKAA